MSDAPSQTIVIGSRKSMGIALILSILFGPLGLLYASVLGGLVLLVFTLIIGAITFGVGALIGWVLGGLRF